MTQTTSPFGFKGTLYPFQTKVLQWTQDLSCGIIGLDMGLGKTVVTLALLAQKQYQRTLIVVPLQVLSQWVKSINQFTTLDHSQIGVFHGTSRHLVDLSNPQYRIVLSTYDLIRYDQESFQMANHLMR